MSFDKKQEKIFFTETETRLDGSILRCCHLFFGCFMGTDEKKMKIARIRAGVRQIELSLRTGISTAYLSLFENGLKTPTSEQAQKINAALGEQIFEEK